MTTSEYHEPVMLQECLDGLQINPDGVYVDVTFGGGGHSKSILNLLGEKGKLVVFDQDNDALKNAIVDERVIFCNHNFQFFKNFLKYYEIKEVHGVLADLGVSSHQINEADRGFSFRYDAQLDMRMNQNADLSALEFVNEGDIEEISRVMKQYGELRNGYKIALAMDAARRAKLLKTTGDLVEVIKPLFPGNQWMKSMAKVFQAIRIHVNAELEALQILLMDLGPAVVTGGRIVVMSYHSLEDRLVKNYINSGNLEGKLEKDVYGNVLKPFKAVIKKPVMASEEEISRNPRARSAKLRIAEKNEGDE